MKQTYSSVLSERVGKDSSEALSPVTIFSSPLPQIPGGSKSGANWFGRTSSVPSTERHADFHSFSPDTYLERVGTESVGPVFLVTGSSGAGKSHVVSTLKDLGITPSERLLTRPVRPGDLSHDRAWDATVNPASLLLSYGKFGNVYGFTDEVIARSLRNEPSTVVIGDIGKAMAFLQALEAKLPLLPVVVLRVDAPADIACHRMKVLRQESYSGEASYRDRVNRSMGEWETQQLQQVKAIAGMHTVVNLTPDEHARLGYNELQLQPLTTEILEQLSLQFLNENRAASALVATDISRNRHIRQNLDDITPGTFAALRSLISFYVDKGKDVIVKGGLAVSLYGSDAVTNSEAFEPFTEFKRNRILLRTEPVREFYRRPVSPDIDLVLTSAGASHLLGALVSDMGGDVSDLKDHRGKALFKSRKLIGTVSRQGELIDIDGIEISRIQPDDSAFCFTFHADDVTLLQSRTFSIDGVGRLKAVPPELLIVEKLLAGRGKDLGKYDTEDAIFLIGSQPIRFELIHRLVTLQEYSPRSEFDDPIVETWSSQGPKNWTDNIDLYCKAVAIQNPRLRDIIAERLGKGGGDNLDATFSLPLSLTPTVLKQMAMVDRLLTGISGADAFVARQPDGDLPYLPGQTVREKLHTLEDLLIHLARYHIGRADILIPS